MSIGKSCEILEATEQSLKTRSFLFNFEARVEPGQFLMVRVPGGEEIPISVSASGGKRVELTVHAVGETTKTLNKMRPGEFVGLRGPYGKGFVIKGKKIAIVAGGCGAAPLVFLAERAAGRGVAVESFIGAKTEKELLFRDRFATVGKLHCATDDGSCGHTGFVTEALVEALKHEKVDCVYTCGPEVLMKNVMDFCVEKKLDMQASLERYMKCGVGLCGSCLIDGLRVCADGPVFDISILKKFREFGSYKRDPCGSQVPLK